MKKILSAFVLGLTASLLAFAPGNSLLAETTVSNAPPTAITKGQRIYAAHHSYFPQVPAILNELATAAFCPW